MLVDVMGVAYEVEVSSAVLAASPQMQSEVVIHTHLVVREDAQLLFGFVSKSERDLFRAYIKINGVGPKLALALISSVDPGTLALAVRNNDVSALTKVPGVGKKTAERLMVELKNRIDDLSQAGGVNMQVVSIDGVSSGQGANEAEDALVALGYRPNDARAAVDRILAEQGESGELGTEEIVRMALKNFGKQRA